MNIHEYQAKKILSGYGIKTPKGGIAYTPSEPFSWFDIGTPEKLRQASEAYKK